LEYQRAQLLRGKVRKGQSSQIPNKEHKPGRGAHDSAYRGAGAEAAMGGGKGMGERR